jgi:lipopolysaccharide export system permease protein
MKVLTRYLLRSHIGPLLFAFVALTGVILINTLAKELANLAGKGLPLDVVSEFFLLSLPANIALTLPMAVLVSVLYTFSSLASENEITALRASGVDLRRAALPLVLVAAVIAASMVWFNDRVLPASNYRWRVLMTDVAQTRPLLALQPQVINPIPLADGTTPYYLEAQNIEAGRGFLQKVSIYDVSNPQVTRTIKADSGLMAFNPEKTDLLLKLFNGDMWEVNFSEPDNFQVVDFKQQTMRMEGVSDRLQRTAESSYRTDRDMTVGMMRARIDTLETELTELRTNGVPGLGNTTLPSGTSTAAPSTQPISLNESAQVLAANAQSGAALALADANASTDQLALLTAQAPAGQERPPSATVDPETQRYIDARADNVEYQIREFQVEIQKKFSIAAATLVFVLIGIPIGLRFPRGGIGMVIAVSLTIFGVYYVGLIGGETLGDDGYVPPVIAMWATNVIFGVLGIIGFLRLGREQGTGRGTGWGDLPDWLRFGRS